MRKHYLCYQDRHSLNDHLLLYEKSVALCLLALLYSLRPILQHRQAALPPAAAHQTLTGLAEREAAGGGQKYRLFSRHIGAACGREDV